MLFVCALALTINAAEPAYTDGEWIYAADGVTKVTLYDTEGNPLVWYMKGEELKYVRADQTDNTLDVYIKYEIGEGGSGFDKSVFSPQKTLKSIKIYDGGEEIIGSGSNLQAQKIVLLNLRDLDVDAFNGWLFGNKNGCCPMLRGIYLPSTLQGIGQEGFTNTKLVQIWNLENTQLFYTNSSDFAATSTLTQEATGGVFKLPHTMMRPILVQNSKITTYIMNPYMDYPSLNQKWHQIFRNCKQLKEIYCPAQVNIGFGEEAFRDTPNQYVVFITGTKEDAENALLNTASYCNGGFKAAEILSYEEYLANKEAYDASTTKVYAVYGYDYCTAFFDGHSWKGQSEIIMTSYFEAVGIGDSCANCGKSDVKSTIDALFVSKGISTKTFGTDIGLVQSYEVNRTAIEAYRKYVTDFDFGVLAYANVGGTAVAPKPGDDKVVDIVFDNMVNDYIEVKVVGIPSKYIDTAIVFCIYATEGEKHYYLDNGHMTETVLGHSYNGILG